MPSENEIISSSNSQEQSVGPSGSSLSKETSLRIDRLIGRTADRYPFGIPSQVIAQARERRVHELALRKKVLFLVTSTTSALSEDEEALLNSIIEKGLALRKDQIATHVCDLSQYGNEIGTWLGKKSVESPACVVIAMGFQHSPHGTWTGDDPQFLHTVSLTEVLSSKESKRLFWGHLQGVISRIKV